MTRTPIAVPIILLGLFFLFGCRRTHVETPSPSARADHLPTPDWLKNEPLVVAGGWDSMPIFRRRVGGSPEWQEDDYRRELAEETAKGLKDLGVTLAVIHFYKGFGLEAEKEHMDDARKLTALLKRHGIRVGVYIGSTIAYETFLAEKPEAREWLVPDYLGRPVIYYDQTFRKRVYFMHPGYREYMKRVLRIAVEDFKVDEIDFDNTSLQAQPMIFHHPLAVKEFQEYLKNRYPPEMLKRRFGFTNMEFVVPPASDRPMSAINDPLFQEWADFRCLQLNRYYAEMADHIRSMNPNVIIATNPHSGISGVNTVWEQGVDYPAFVRHMDIVWTEEGNEAGVSPDGVLISKIRTYKMATSLRKRVITYTAGTRGGKLQMAESMAFNRQGLGQIGGILSGYDFPSDQVSYVRFFHDNFEYFRDIDNIADVAVLHSRASMAFNNDRPWQSTMLVEQALIQAHVPFDIIFDEHLKDLSKYRVLVLADQECLNDEQMGLIRKFVNAGGGLVATEHTSLYTEWRRRRRDFGLRDLFQVPAPRWTGTRGAERQVSEPTAQHQLGAGRVVYIPEVKAAVEKPPAVRMNSQYWRLPLNWKELLYMVKWAAGDSLSLEVVAPVTVVSELLEQKEKGRLLVHFLNYGVERTPVVKSIGVSLRIPNGKRVDSVSLVSPDDEAQVLEYTMERSRLRFTVPQLQTYSIAVVQTK